MIRRLLPALLLFALGATIVLLARSQQGAVNTVAPVAQLAEDKRPYLPPEIAPTHKPERVVVFVIDGLRHDASRNMPALANLRTRGFDGTARAVVPSLSRPSWTAMFTGAQPGRSGVRTNQYSTPVTVDTIFARAKDQGLASHGFVGIDWWEDNFVNERLTWESAPADATLDQLKAGTERALSSNAGLIVVHLVHADQVAHATGTGEAYSAALDAIDDVLGSALGRIDLGRDAVFVVSDHGHLDRGGHGGAEDVVLSIPVVAAGVGIRQTTDDEPTPLGSAAGLAPTLSLLLGLEFPRDHEVPPWRAVVAEQQLGAAYVERRMADSTAQQVEYLRRWLHQVYENWTSTAIDGEVVGNDVSTAATLPDNPTETQIRDAAASVLVEIDRDRRVARTPAIAIVLVVLGLLLVVGLMQGYRVAPLSANVVLLGAPVLVAVIRGIPLSRSGLANSERFVLDTGIAAAIAFVLFVGLVELMVWGLDRDERRGARRFHIVFGGLLAGAVAPVLWLVSGYALDAPLPSVTLFFLPTWAAVTGAWICGFCAMATLFLPLPTPVPETRPAPVSPVLSPPPAQPSTT